MVNTKLEARALRTAAVYHEGQYRKGKDVPYIVHPVEVAMILQQQGMSAEVIAAGFLHDLLEDTEMTSAGLKKLFNERILELVLAASEKLENRENTAWKVRKSHTLNNLPGLEKEMKYLVCADKLSNARSMLRNYNEIGDQLWERFSAGYEEQKWYYNNLVKNLQALTGEEIYENFKKVVAALFSE